MIATLGLVGLAYWQRGIALDQRDKALLTQSRFLAHLGRQAGNSGDAVSEMLFAVAGLTDEADGSANVSSRPYSIEAEQSLYQGLLRRRELADVAANFYRLENGQYISLTSAQFSADGKYIQNKRWNSASLERRRWCRGHGPNRTGGSRRARKPCHFRPAARRSRPVQGRLGLGFSRRPRQHQWQRSPCGQY